MALRITKIEQDLPKLNRELARLDGHSQQLTNLQQQITTLRIQLTEKARADGIPNQNNIIFVWTGSTTTVSWVAGFVKDHSGVFQPVPAGSRGSFTASTNYWAGWNPLHKSMSFVTSLGAFKGNPNILVICKFFTGTGAQSGNLGGGGTDTGSDGLNGKEYKLF